MSSNPEIETATRSRLSQHSVERTHLLITSSPRQAAIADGPDAPANGKHSVTCLVEDVFREELAVQVG